MSQLNVTIYNEFVHEQKNEFVKKIYPNGIHEAIASYMRNQPDLTVRTATLEEPEHGLTQEVLDQTDVLMWSKRTSRTRALRPTPPLLSSSSWTRSWSWLSHSTGDA